MAPDEMLFQLPPHVDPRWPEEKGAWIDACKRRLIAMRWLRLNSQQYVATLSRAKGKPVLRGAVSRLT